MKVIRWVLFTIILLSSLQPVYALQHHKPHKKLKRVRTIKLAAVPHVNARAVRIHRRFTYKRPLVFVPAIMALPNTKGTYQLAQALNREIEKEMENTSIAVYVKSMQHGDTLFSRNSNNSLTPASTSKIFTAEAALLYLGGDYQFSTQLLTNAKSIKNKILQGDLYVLLSGDPTLTYTDLAELMTTLQDRGIQAIAGNVYIDNTAYDQTFFGPDWEYKDKQSCYGAPISASIINRNCISFGVAPGHREGYAAELHTSPKFFYPGINNAVITKSRYSRGCSLHVEPGQNGTIDLAGCLPIGRYTRGISYVVTDIPEYNRQLFKGLLNELGIHVYGMTTFKSAPKQLALLGSHNSKPLKDLIHEMLKKSDNIIAGALFKKIGQMYTHQSGSWENGSYAVSQILQKRAGLNISGLRILDGSGLSPSNLATPSQFMQVLHFSFHDQATRDQFISALPVAGVDGTLKHRLSNVARRVQAKTGTISGVISLAGYTQSANNEPVAFVIMINGSKGKAWRYRSLEDKIVTLLTKYTR